MDRDLAVKLGEKLWKETLAPAGMVRKDYRRYYTEFHDEQNETGGWSCIASPNADGMKLVPFSEGEYRARFLISNTYVRHRLYPCPCILIYKFKEDMNHVSEWCRIFYKPINRR